MTNNFYPHIDYRLHPAFRHLDVDDRKDNSQIENMIFEIDEALINLNKMTFFDNNKLLSIYENEIFKKINNLNSYLQTNTDNERIVEWLNKSFKDTIIELKKEIIIKNKKNLAKYNNMSIGDKNIIYNKLDADGFYSTTIDDISMQKINSLIQPVVARLREQSTRLEHGRLAESIPLYSPVGDILAKYFKNSGIIEGLSLYVGSNVNFTGFSVEYSHKNQIWWRGCYDDEHIEQSKTTYMHYDHGCRDPKAIIFLNNVTCNNGPTSYVKGSHKECRSNFLHFFIKSLDISFVDFQNNHSENKDYRRRFGTKFYRREFLSLPKAFQACSHFGDDIENNSNLSRELLAREQVVTGNAGTCVVFDGNYGIHRGSLVNDGERFVFQVIFDIDDLLPKYIEYYRRGRAMLSRSLKTLR